MPNLKDLQNKTYPVSNIYCVGRNYSEHAKELGNEVPSEPVIFLKSTGSLGPQNGTFKLPSGEFPQHEVEMVLWMKSPTEVGAIAVGIDLTLRKLQGELKKNGLPWTKAKSFLNSALVSPLAPAVNGLNLEHLDLRLEANGELRQSGNTSEMLFKPGALIAYLNRLTPLMEGDLIFTGTPKGVAEIHPGQTLVAQLGGITEATWIVGA